MSHDVIATLLPILAMLLFASIVGGAALLMARFLGPHRLVGHKIEPYECGIPPTGQARDRISIKYFLVAILFLLFDLEAAFLLPVALAWKEMAPIGFMVLGFTAFFLFFFLLSLWYEFRVKALEWEQ